MTLVAWLVDGLGECLASTNVLHPQLSSWVVLSHICRIQPDQLLLLLLL